MRKIKYVLLAVLLCVFVSQTVFANDAIFGQVLADMYRIRTGSDMALVFEDDISADNSNPSVVNVYMLGGNEIYSSFDKIINENQENIYLSGASITINSTIGGGGHKSIAKITLNDAPLLTEGLYSIALNDKNSYFFDNEKIVASYTSNDAALYEYITTFKPYDKASKSTEETSANGENSASDIVSRQSSTLVMALVVLFAVLVVYFIVKRKQKKIIN